MERASASCVGACGSEVRMNEEGYGEEEEEEEVAGATEAVGGRGAASGGPGVGGPDAQAIR